MVGRAMPLRSREPGDHLVPEDLVELVAADFVGAAVTKLEDSARDKPAERQVECSAAPVDDQDVTPHQLRIALPGRRRPGGSRRARPAARGRTGRPNVRLRERLAQCGPPRPVHDDGDGDHRPVQDSRGADAAPDASDSARTCRITAATMSTGLRSTPPTLTASWPEEELGRPHGVAVYPEPDLFQRLPSFPTHDDLFPLVTDD